MSERTHQYRMLGRRDPAITVQLFGVDATSGDPVALEVEGGKLLVETSGGGGVQPVSVVGTADVALQGVAEVKATSANFWALAKGDQPIVIPGFTDADGWFDARAFSRFSAVGSSKGYTYDLAAGFVALTGTVHEVTDYAGLVSHIASVSPGDVIFLRDGVYEVPSGTLTVDKELTIIGESRDGVIIQTPVQAAPGVNDVITIAANNVQIRNLTVYHRQTATSGGASETCIRTDAARTGIVLDTLRLRYMEYGLSLHGQFSVRSCAFEYELGAVSNTHRCIILYGTSGDCEILDCTASFGTYTTAQGRFIQTGAVGGSDYSGELIVARNQYTSGRCNSVLYIESLPGAADALTLALIANDFPAEATNVIILGGADTLGEVTLHDNVASTALKGYIGFDVVRASPLVLHESGNTVVDPTVRADYVSIYGGWLVTARNTVTPVPTVTADAIIPDFGIPAGTGDSVLLEDHISVDVDYRVSMQEPTYQLLTSGNLNSAYHKIQDPLVPADILGIGYLRLRSHASANRGGYFAVFGSLK